MSIRFALAATAITAAAVGFAAAATPATAAATTTDDTFLSELVSQGIGFVSSQVALTNAHMVCGAMASGTSPVDITRRVMSNSDLSSYQAAYFVVDSVQTYCGKFSSMLPA